MSDRTPGGTALVTGAAGFIGSFLCEGLVAAGYSVVGADNFFRGTRANLKGLEGVPDFELVEIDLSLPENVGTLRELLRSRRVDTVFHLAAVNGTEYFYDRPAFVFDQNTACTNTLLAAITDTEVDYLIYASSSEVYGEPRVIPTHEACEIVLRPEEDRDSYAASKAFGDFAVRMAARRLGVDHLVLRIFNQYGTRMVASRYGQVIPEFMRRTLADEPFTIIGDGSQTRSFCYVEDAVEAVKRLVGGRCTGVLNLGNDEEVTILELARRIHALVGRPFEPVFLPPRSGDHLRRRPDITRLRAAVPGLRFTPLDDGLRRLMGYYDPADGPGSKPGGGPDA